MSKVNTLNNWQTVDSHEWQALMYEVRYRYCIRWRDGCHINTLRMCSVPEIDMTLIWRKSRLSLVQFFNIFTRIYRFKKNADSVQDFSYNRFLHPLNFVFPSVSPTKCWHLTVLYKLSTYIPYFYGRERTSLYAGRNLRRFPAFLTKPLFSPCFFLSTLFTLCMRLLKTLLLVLCKMTFLAAQLRYYWVCLRPFVLLRLYKLSLFKASNLIWKFNPLF